MAVDSMQGMIIWLVREWSVMLANKEGSCLYWRGVLEEVFLGGIMEVMTTWTWGNDLGHVEEVKGGDWEFFQNVVVIKIGDKKIIWGGQGQGGVWLRVYVWPLQDIQLFTGCRQVECGGKRLGQALHSQYPLPWFKLCDCSHISITFLMIVDCRTG
jgi:hypothetical protein